MRNIFTLHFFMAILILFAIYMIVDFRMDLFLTLCIELAF